MRKDGIEGQKGIYCKVCGYCWEGWGSFFQHHREKHQDTDPETLGAAIQAGREYTKWWRELMGIRADDPWNSKIKRIDVGNNKFM